VKKLADVSAEELAGLVCEALLKAGITTTLSGGGCVAIWSEEGKYVSRDLDFIEEGPVPRRKVKAVMGSPSRQEFRASPIQRIRRPLPIVRQP